MIKRIHIYDFDNTLMATPFPERGIPEWESMTGKDFPDDRIYWETQESLDPRLGSIKPFYSIVTLAEDSARDPEVLSILMTGRKNFLEDQVMNLIELYDLNIFDAYYLSDGDTLTFKCDKLRELTEQNGAAEEIVMWEDREEHWAPFENMSQELGIPVRVNRVIDGNVQ